MPRETASFQAVRELFDALLDLDPAARAARLAAECGDDAELRRRVEALLEHDGAPHPGLDRSPAAALAPAADVPPPLPARIGPYEIVRVLGVGGMGIVYEAAQPELGRRVALKVVRSTLLGPEQRRRAQQEGPVLARLRHPGIATIHEIGRALVDGVEHPYLAMELVEGRPLDVHAREAGLDLRARLALMARVARAVHHAHEAGVLHRDLKPANVLVDARGEPRVLDFGVARLLERDGTTTVTATGTVVGTLGHMSPEQVSGRGLDARSDVYALGVLLYELVSGRLPHDVADLPLPEAARRICERSPAALGTLGVPGCPPGSDLETIAAAALAREPERRYASAAALADDLERFLRHEPIAARPASALDHLRLFARRNRGLVAASALAVLALLAGTVVSGWMALRQRDLRRAAERLAYRANVNAAFLALEDDNPAQARRLLADVRVEPVPWELARLERELAEWVAALPSGIGHVWQAGFADGGRSLVALSSGGTLARWDVASRERTLLVPDDERRALPVALSADGATALSIAGKRARLWSTATGEVEAEPEAPLALSGDPRHTAAFAADGRRVALTATDRRVLVLDRASATFLGPFEPGIPALDARGARLVLAGARRVLVRAVDTGALVADLPGPPAPPRSLTLSADGSLAFVADEARALHVLALADGRAHALAADLPDVALSLALDPSGSFLAAMLDDGSVWLWDLASERVRHRFRVGRSSWKTSLAWSPDASLLLSAAHTHDELILWDGHEALEPDVMRGHTSFVYPAVYALGGARIVSGSWDGTVRLWDPRGGRELATLRPHRERSQTLAVSPDGTLVASGSPDRSLVLLDAASGAERARIDGPSAWSALAWGTPGLYGGTRPAPGQVLRLDGTLAIRATLELSGEVEALAVAPVGERLAVATDTHLRILGTAALDARAECQARGTCALAFAPDGRTLASGDSAGRIVLWDADTLVERRILTGHRQEVFGLAFAPDGSRLFSGGRDARLRVWDPSTGDLLAEIPGAGDYLWSVAVSPDGTRVLAGSGDGTVRQWDSEPARVTWERRRAAEER